MCAATELAAQLADPAALGRLLTRVENEPQFRAQLLAQLPLPAQRSHRVGITGSPGVGKSTLLSLLVPELVGATRASPAVDEPGHVSGDACVAPTKVALLAIDPTSEQTGGAVLADRFRWNDLPPGVFVRSLASRGSLAGVSAATDACARVLAAAGYDPIVIETVGVGQTGFAIRHLADTVVVLLSPESGDALQLLKAGLIETGDIFVVNKADRPGADALLTDLRSALETDSGVAVRPVLAVSALNGEGISELAEAIKQHLTWLGLQPSNPGERQLRQLLEAEVRVLLAQQAQSAFARVELLLPRVLSGELSVEQAAQLLIKLAPDTET